MTRLLVRADQRCETVGLVKRQLQDSVRAFGGFAVTQSCVTNRVLAPNRCGGSGEDPCFGPQGLCLGQLVLKCSFRNLSSILPNSEGEASSQYITTGFVSRRIDKCRSSTLCSALGKLTSSRS